jgi:Flp pilus assembly protein TadD
MVALRPGAMPPMVDLLHYMEAVAGLEAVGRGDAAARAYEAAARQWPDEPLPRLALANLAHARGDLRAAEQGFKAATRLDPANVAARNNRAEVLRQMGCLTLARREIDVALALAAGGPLAASVDSTARAIAAQGTGDAAGCPAD